MRLRLLFLAVFSLSISSGCATFLKKDDSANGVAPLVYEVDLNDRSDDTFKVKLHVDNLTAANAVYQFAATAPGTYITMDMGRFVRQFQVFDAAGRPMNAEQISNNQWKIARPENVRLISYAIAETWDTPMDSRFIP